MEKYQVTRETYQGKFIEDLGEMTLEQIEELAKKYLGDVFTTEEEIKSDIEFIKQDGYEQWLCNNEIQITIEKVGD